MSGEDADKGIQFSGDFTPEERQYLATQFSQCRFQLVRRSQADPKRALVTWTAAAALRQGASQGPGPLRGVPQVAAYVLGSNQPPSLVRVQSRDDLAREFGDRLEGVDIPGLGAPNPAWETMKDALRGLLPFRPR